MLILTETHPKCLNSILSLPKSACKMVDMRWRCMMTSLNKTVVSGVFNTSITINRKTLLNIVKKSSYVLLSESCIIAPALWLLSFQLLLDFLMRINKNWTITQHVDRVYTNLLHLKNLTWSLFSSNSLTSFDIDSLENGGVQ